MPSRSSRPLLLLSLFAVLLAALSMAQAQEPVQLRLMAYNIHHAEGTDKKFDLWRIADVIKKAKPDLVAVQEVDVLTRRSKHVDQAKKLAELTGMHYVFGKFMDYSGGEYGQMVLSKFPIKSSKNHPLPPGPEPRTALEVRVEVPFGGEGEGEEATKRELVFVGNHLYATEEQRMAQAKTLLTLFKDEKVPVILAGDFNTEPNGAPMLALTKHWHDPTWEKIGGTWPSGEPRVEIDYILYAPKEKFRFIESKVIPEKRASDHRPVVTVVEWE